MADRGDPFVVVTNREIYDVVMHIKGDVATLKQSVGTYETEQEKQGKRIGRLEFRYYAILAGLIGTFASVGVSLGAATGAL